MFKIFHNKIVGVCVECFYRERKQFLHIKNLYLQGSPSSKQSNPMPIISIVTAISENVFGSPISEVVYKTNPKSVKILCHSLVLVSKKINQLNYPYYSPNLAIFKNQVLLKRTGSLTLK